MALCCAIPAACQTRGRGTAEEKYGFKFVRSGKGYNAVRWELETGKSWYLSGKKCYPIAEKSGRPGPGKYTIVMTTLPDRDGFIGFRYDPLSGRAWILDPNWEWRLIPIEKTKFLDT